MLRRITPIITIFSFVFLLLFSTSKVTAATPNSLTELDTALNESSMNKNLQDFCKKRQGNQMNLETWYSGKCTDDTFSGDGVGFSDIVILDLAEKIKGKNDPSNTFSKTLKEAFDLLGQLPADATEQQKLATLDLAREKIFATQNTGLVSQSGKIIGQLFKTQPASSASYFSYVASNLQKHRIIPDTLAATATNGIGFSTFSPFLTIWMAFRNIAYLALVVFFIMYGFMMMFRVNLGQKTAITVQLAIPKLIVTLLIITFSYAIVGLIYDLMWVVIYFIFSYLGSQNLIVNRTVLSPALGASGNSGLIVSFLINSIVAGPAAVFGVLNMVFGGLAAAVGTVAVGITAGFFIELVVIIAVLISYGKLFFKLISSFISIVISLITAPIILLGNAFPGSSSIGDWFRGIVANLSVFPVTMLLLLFSYLLMIQPVVGICTNSTPSFVTSFLNNAAPTLDMGPCELIFGVKSLVDGNIAITGMPLISFWSGRAGDTTVNGTDARGLLALFGVGLLLMTSKYVDIVKDALKVPPFKYGSAIGDALKQGWTKAGLVPRYGESERYKKASEVFGLKAGPSARTPAAKPDDQAPIPHS